MGGENIELNVCLFSFNIYILINGFQDILQVA